MKFLALILSLSLLVFIHELGHYLFARLFKTRVRKFYLFFNPYFSILRAKKIDGRWRFSFFSKQSPQSFTDHDESTEWGIGWVPFGGYCEIAGMIDENNTSAEALSSEPQQWEYRSKPAWQRLLIVLGGVLMNFVGALVIFAAILFVWGKETLPLANAKLGYEYSQTFINNGFRNGDIIIAINGNDVTEISDAQNSLLLDDAKQCKVKRGDSVVEILLPDNFAKQVVASEEKSLITPLFPFVVGEFAAGSAAQTAGMRQGDSIVALDGTPTASFSEFVRTIKDKANKEVAVSFYRNNELKTLPIKLGSDAKIGVYPKDPLTMFETHKTEYSLLESIPAGVEKGTSMLVNYVKQFKLIFSKEGARQVGGFGAIGGLFPSSWDWQVFWYITAFLSIILAFMNILPIPALDGGHVFFVLWEMISGRKPGDKFLARAQTVGMILLFALLIYANGNDLIRWLSSKF
ncbi:MAG: RIP metalloprotease RseP [Bacteroidales bacterium]|jgi:regulator of sigma E protease|nr:RIP metalloprotease RseP [Bacteroidales bacterium]